MKIAIEEFIFEYQNSLSYPLASQRSYLTRLQAALRWARDLDAQIERNKSDSVPTNYIFSSQTKVSEQVSEWDLTTYQKERENLPNLIRPLLQELPEETHLYFYQTEAVKWLCKSKFAILADDMGMGKTVQVIASIRRLISKGDIRHALVVCPKSLISNWQAELEKWAPELTFVGMTPNSAIREKAWQRIWNWKHIYITNYEHLATLALSKEITFDLIVADEAHRLRSSRSKLTQAMRCIQSERFWALTGTPIENSVKDFDTLLSVIHPRRWAPGDISKLPLASIRAQGKKYVLRRRKEDALDHLPSVVNRVEVIDLTSEQQQSYSGLIQKFRDEADYDSQISLFRRLLSCCDIDPISGKSAKLDRILEMLELIAENSEKAIVFSYTLPPLESLSTRINKKIKSKKIAFISGELDLKERDRRISEFKNNDDHIALLATIQIAGVGLNLTEANHVFFINQWFNPSANEQAQDRVNRLGQQKQVFINRFICRNTVESRIENILGEKEDLIENLIEPLSVTADMLNEIKQSLP